MTVSDIFDIATVKPKKELFKDEDEMNKYSQMIKIEKKKK
jgi:hypothetical protein